MKEKIEKPDSRDDLRPEYDLSKLGKGVRGKHLAKLRSGTNLDPEETSPPD